MEIDNIYNMDCLEGMKQIPDGTIDAVICDLPYGTTQCPWDAVIPFDKMWEQYLRITKPNAAIVLFCQGMFTSDLMQSNRKMWRYNLIWKKGNQETGHLNASRMPLRNHEDIAVFYCKLPTYNPQPFFGNVKHDKTKYNGTQKEKSVYNSFTANVVARDGDRYPLSVIDVPRNWKRQDQLHPTQKPVDLLRYLVLTYTNEGDTVLDNCMGSGTTAIACIKERRHFIGFELSKEYFDKAVKRIDTERRQLTLF